jgi:hypothetical protein
MQLHYFIAIKAHIIQNNLTASTLTLESNCSLIIPHISTQPFLPQNSTHHNYVSTVCLKTAMASTSMLADQVHCKLYVYLQALFHCLNIPGSICTIQNMELKWKCDNITFFCLSCYLTHLAPRNIKLLQDCSVTIICLMLYKDGSVFICPCDLPRSHTNKFSNVKNAILYIYINTSGRWKNNLCIWHTVLY